MTQCLENGFEQKGRPERSIQAIYRDATLQALRDTFRIARDSVASGAFSDCRGFSYGGLHLSGWASGNY
jgi:hypothetical protein